MKNLLLLNKKLTEALERNNGDTAKIFDEVHNIISPLVEALEMIQEPFGAYSRDPLTHANNTITNCANIAKTALNTLE